jgi:PAS domain S-box-containing protein
MQPALSAAAHFSRGLLQLRNYLLALGLVAAAFVARLALNPLLGGQAIYLFFILAVLVSSLRLGTWPAAAAAVASAFVATFAFAPPQFAMLPSGGQVANLISFLIISAAIILFSWRMLEQREDLDDREARLATEAREQRLIDAAHDFAIYELDREGRIVTWNKGAEKLKGWKAEEIIGKPYTILHTPESRARNAPGRELKIAADTGRFEEEAARMRKDGSIFAAHVSLFPVRDERGEVTGFVKVTRDISERSKAGKVILESRRRMEAIVQSAMDSIVGFDEELRIILFNPAAEQTFGYSAEEILGKQLSLLFPESFQAREMQNLHELFQAGDLNRRSESLVAVRRNGEEFPIEASISQVNVGGERVGTIILRDITERRTNEEARALLAREVDHRAKNALAVAQALVGLTKADTVETFAEAIRGRIESLGRAHSLLSQSQWRGAPLDQLIRDEIRPYSKEGQLLLNGPKFTCSAGAVQSLSLLFHELATNAVKYGALGSDGGHVTIDWRSDGDTMLIRWKEQGGPRVTPPKREGFGTKLLNQVSGRQLNADLRFDWDPGGLTVEIRLPAEIFSNSEHNKALKSDSDESVEGLADPGRERKILLVEDEELVALELSTELSRLGWAIVGPAATLTEAQSLLSKNFDAAVLDVNLRGRSVYPVAEALEERHVPFVFCTGYEMADPDGRFPGVPVIRKPVHPGAVSAALADLLKARLN